MRARNFVFGMLLFVPTLAHGFTASGRFLYEDRLWDKDGYTGQVQNLPIRHANVEIVNAVSQQVLASGSTDAAGFYSLNVTGQLVPVNLYARCLTDGKTAGYEIRVVNELQRGLGEPAVVGPTHAIMTSLVVGHDPANNLDVGTYLIQDTDGTGVAQAYNIFDNSVDFFDWMARPEILGRLPNATEYIVYAWSGTSANEGSNYSGHAILLSSPGQGNDTDGWSDTVILHETGHWLDDLFSNSDNPGGAHSLGDNNQDPRLSYGEGVATFHCSKVRDLRSRTRLNLQGQPVDSHVSIYGDLMIPPAVGTAGALSFSYDFETGVAFQPGLPASGFVLGQRGAANETNLTSAQWDLVDAADSADETPGVDDDAVAVSHGVCWQIEHVYLRGLPESNWITPEDYYQGWFAVNGPTFLKSAVDNIFVNLSLMEFYPDAFEPDATLATATPIAPVAHTVAAGRKVVINEVDLGAQDAIELYNGSPAAVDLTGWQIQVYVNDDTAPVVSRIFVFPPFTLSPGEVVSVYERGDPLNNGTYHLFAGTTPNAFNASWAHGLDGACVVRDATNNAVDFVHWRSSTGIENNTPIPAGVAFNGSLASPSAPPYTLARDVSGIDSDSATDFTPQVASLASANHPSPVHHTSFGTGDEDLFSFQAVGGTRYGFEARGFFSASDPAIEILSAGGAVLGFNDDSDPAVNDSRIDFYASTSQTYFVRVRHAGAYTDWGAYDLVAFARPVATIFQAPSSIAATADNSSDTNDRVVLHWANAGAYDSVRLYRDGTLLTTLPGAPSEYEDHADRGVYKYEVSGVVGGMETARVYSYEFAGLVTCHVADDFESGNAAQWNTEGTSWGVTPLAAGGTWGFTDSPTGTYDGCPAGESGCSVNVAATLEVPARLPAGSRLFFDHICITEHCEPAPCDLGIVEISTNDGSTWAELARYDQASDPAWGDNVANPEDWRPAVIPLYAYTDQTVLIRFRLQSDAILNLDGWYVDNVRINTGDCPTAVEDEIAAITTLAFAAPAPNPMRKAARFAYALPTQADVEIDIHDVAGRVVRHERLANQTPGRHLWNWDGSDGQGRSVAQGVYFARLRCGGRSLTQKVIKLVD